MDEAKIKKIMEGVIEEARKKFWVDPETHFIHHNEIEGWIKTFGLVKKSVLISFVTGFVAGLGGLIWLGIETYIKFKGHK